MAEPGAPADVSHLDWIGKHPAGQREEWLAHTRHPLQPVRHAIRDYRLLYRAVQCRMGMAYMPCYLADRDPKIVRVPDAPIVHQADIWVLTHKDLRLSARMRVLREVIAGEFERIRPVLDTRPRP
nr:LysR substrate-binding domain-containing protein [Kineobactrum salinum]